MKMKPSSAWRPNRSLERGISILRTFNSGVATRSNLEIAELTGLSKATVSRLARTLAICGLLEQDRTTNAYRLSHSVLGLAEAWLANFELLRVAAPIMNKVSSELRVNVSMVAPDKYEMIYLHSVRQPMAGIPRRIERGHRTPMEYPSYGRVYLAILGKEERNKLFGIFRKRTPEHSWPALKAAIDASITQFHKQGYCIGRWMPGTTAFSSPVLIRRHVPYVVSFGIETDSWTESRIKAELVPSLLQLCQDLQRAMEQPPEAARAAGSK